MHKKESENLALLQGHLVKDSLAWKLVAAYGSAPTLSEAQPALDAVLNTRLKEVLNAIEHGTAKLG